MSTFTLPTPEEVKYKSSSDTVLDEILSHIKETIVHDKFTFIPKYHWVSLLSEVNRKISEFGWRIRKEWNGTQDDGYIVWIIEPKNNLNNENTNTIGLL